MRFAILIACLVACARSGADARTLLKVEGTGAGTNLLEDPGFEQAESPWKKYGRGFTVDAGARHSGTSSIRCENPTADVSSGAFRTIVLDQKSPRPIRASVLSKAEGVGPAAQGDYALYLDVQYDDGSWVWGQIYDFAPGTHDWESGEVAFEPERPIKEVNVYLLQRRCVGKTWFDDCRLEELGASEGRALFDGVVVSKAEAVRHFKRRALQTSDGLTIHFSDEGMVANDRRMHAWLADGGFYMRDVAAGSDFVGLESRKALDTPPDSRMDRADFAGDALGIALDVRASALKDHIRFDCEARDTTGRDRAMTIGFALPVGIGRGVGSARWWHSIRSSEEVQADRSYCDGVPIEAGAVGQISKYPFACLGSQCLAIPMDEPCVYRIGYNGQLGWYYIAFDLGFCPEQGVTKQRFSFLIYKTDGPGGMRAAADKYYRIFPDSFVKQVEREGNWMAFRKVGAVKDWQDFGFAFHEGDNDIAWDAANNIYSFRYTEPMSYWMPLAKDVPRTPEKAMELIESDLAGGDPAKKEWASATTLCLAEDEQGRRRIFFFDAPWCDGAMFVLNCDPAIPRGDFPATKASMSWNPTIAERLYGKDVSPQLAGEYLDSVEMASEYVNTRREHFRYAVRPLSFTRRTKKPAILQILSTYEFARNMADDVHARGRLMMANTIPTRYGFMAHLFDVLGIETNWLLDGKYHPLADEVMDLRRTLCYKKPYCFLMNTDYETFDHSMVEKYMQRCMFWGMFPGFFSPDAATRLYFEQPKYYERDRDLFKKYMPVIKRIAAAGWAPITMAETADPKVEVERFGPGKDGALFFTIRNGGDKAVTAQLLLNTKLGKVKSAAKLPGDSPLSVKPPGEIEVPLDPGEVAVVEVKNEQ